MSPTQRSLKRARAAGGTAQVVEHWIPYAGRRKDLFGCIDLLVIRPGMILGVQACTATNHTARRAKAIAEPQLRRWLEAGGQFEIWSWRKVARTGRWGVRVEAITLARLDAERWFG